MAGQNVYKGSNSNGVRSLSLPKWRESFVVSGIMMKKNYIRQLFGIRCLSDGLFRCVSVGKPKKGVIYPSTLDYVPSRPTYVKTSERRVTVTLHHHAGFMWHLQISRILLLGTKGYQIDVPALDFGMLNFYPVAGGVSLLKNDKNVLQHYAYCRHSSSPSIWTTFICHLLTGQKEAKSAAVTTVLPMTTAPEPTTTTTPEPTTTTTTLAPTTTTTPSPPPTTTKARAAVHKVRDAGELNKRALSESFLACVYAQ